MGWFVERSSGTTNPRGGAAYDGDDQRVDLQSSYDHQGSSLTTAVGVVKRPFGTFVRFLEQRHELLHRGRKHLVLLVD